MNGTFLFFLNYIYATFHSFTDVLVNKLGSIHFLIEQKIEPTVISIDVCSAFLFVWLNCTLVL